MSRFFALVVCIGLMTVACKPLVNFLAFHPDDTSILAAEALPPETDEVFFETEDGNRIQALHLRHPTADTMTLFFHGNAGNIYHRLTDFHHLRSLGTGVFAVSYRGYAKSQGGPSEDGIYLDGKAAFDYVTKTMKVPPARVYILGRSIGSTVATDLAQGKDIAGLILVSPLSSGRDMASAMGLSVAKPLAGNAFANAAKIKNLKSPVLVIHGSNDRVIPIGQGRKVFDAAPGKKSFHEIPGAGHNDLTNRFGKSYWTAIGDFLKLRAKPGGQI